MPFAAALSNRPQLDVAVAEATESIRNSLKGSQPQLTCVFVSHHYASEMNEIPSLILRALGDTVLIGCTGEAIVGGGRECESEPALSIWCGSMPEAELTPFHLSFEETPDGLLCSGFPDDLGESRDSTRAILALGEPYSSAPQSVIDVINDELSGVPLIGGMASGGPPGSNLLFLNEQTIETGAVGLVIRGGPRIRTVVSQGCRPIGIPFVVTRSERNLILELGGEPPLQRLEAVYQQLPPRDQKLVEGGVHLGVAMNEYQDRFHRGDFLIVNVFGVDPESGALAAGGIMRVGQTVQFHIRDSETADEDLKHLLKDCRDQGIDASRGAILFSCNGRGTRMFPSPHHDASTVQQLLGPLPLAGFFAQGELGPIGRKNYIHGFTASLAMFEEH